VFVLPTCAKYSSYRAGCRAAENHSEREPGRQRDEPTT
jgi:hypothetical protein